MEFVYELANILYKMFTPHQTSRLNINDVLPLYEACLEKHILKGKKLQFKDHKISKLFLEIANKITKIIK